MTRKLKVPVLVVFFLLATAGSALASADVIELEGSEDNPIESFTILEDVAASYEQSVSQQPSHGNITELNAPNYLTYSPDLNYNGPDTFAIKVRIEYEDPDTPPEDWVGVYHVNILPVNDHPIATALSASTLKNIDLSLVLAGSDPVEGSPLTYSIGTFPAHGTLSDASHGQITEDADQHIVYTPAPGFVGSDSFSYMVFDGADYSYEAVAQITVIDSNILTVSFAGSGHGTVYSTPAGIACVTGSSAGCQLSFSAGGSVDLIQIASAHSDFEGWSGACAGTGACQVTMDSAQSVIAGYKVTPATVRIDGQATFYYKLGETLDLVSMPGRTVRSKAVTFPENVIMVSPVSVLLKGGYTDDAFSSRTAASRTVIDGNLKIRQGSLRIERLVIR